nr:rhodanese-like domain-containing protein [Paenibacillus hamazuiensis]
MAIVFALVVLVLASWGLRRIWPAKGLNWVDPQSWKEAIDRNSEMKLLDVRDAMDYEACHVNGSINISLGRLPVLWKKELSPEDSVLIIADGDYERRSAARILRRRGFRKLYTGEGKGCA